MVPTAKPELPDNGDSMNVSEAEYCVNINLTIIVITTISRLPV